MVKIIFPDHALKFSIREQNLFSWVINKLIKTLER